MRAGYVSVMLFGTLVLFSIPSFLIMSVVKTVVDAETKRRFQAAAHSRGVSESEYLRTLVMNDLEPDRRPPSLPEITPENAQLERMMVRLPGFVMDGVKERARIRGMAPSRWIAGLVASNLTAVPVLNHLEMLTIMASTRELAAIGRNLNQIARALHLAPYESERVKLEQLAELSAAIKANREAIMALVAAANEIWEPGDGWHTSQNSWKALEKQGKP